jgi:hypothetical protein
MLASAQVTGFRGFRELRLDGLARVNLLVGRNNTGKSSVLEAIEILMSGGTAEALWRVASRRNERAHSEERVTAIVCHMFHGHHLTLGARFDLRGQGQPQAECTFEVVEAAQGQLALDSSEAVPELALRATSSFMRSQPLVALSGADGALPTTRPRMVIEGLPRVLFLPTGAVDDSFVQRLWDAVVLTPDEERVVAAMRIIEPRIEGLAFLSGTGLRFSPSAVVRLRGVAQRVPLGTMGDGVKRLLALALALTRAVGGFLLVDEIDTSLHHSVMTPMWRLVLETAKRLDVQVFATSHSHDGLRALAAVCADSPELRGDVAVHRIDKGREEVVRYSGEELEVVIEHDLEIRG